MRTLLMVLMLSCPSVSLAGFGWGGSGGTGLCTRTTAPAWMSVGMWRIFVANRWAFCALPQRNPDIGTDDLGVVVDSATVGTAVQP